MQNQQNYAHSVNENQQSRLQERLMVRHSDFADVHLPELPQVPGMVTPNECRYLYWLTSQGYTGTGAVLEMGTWLGRSSTYLGAGLRDSGFQATLNCVDKFEWNRFMDAPHLARQTTGLSIKPGDDFQKYFEANVKPVYSNLRVFKSSVKDFKWSHGSIEILFLDAPKNLEDYSAVLVNLGKYLIPGLSVIVLQDYLHSPSYPLAVVTSVLRDQLELLHTVALSSTASFLVKKPLTFNEPQPEWNFRNWSKDQVTDAWNHILEPLPIQQRSYLEPGFSMHLLDVGERDEAINVIKKIKLTPDGLKRLQFMLSAPQYVERYKALYEATMEQNN